MPVNWSHLYQNVNAPQWYRVVTDFDTRYLLLVDMDGILVSLPYFSWALLTRQKPDKVAEHITFTLKADRLICSDNQVKWQVRMLRKVSGNIESHKVASWLALETDAKLQLAALPSNVRRKIRKAEKNGITTVTGGPELVKQFYHVYVRNMHRLGAPAMSPDFYRNVAEAFGPDAKVMIAKYKGINVGAALWLRNGSNAEACWFATLEDYNALYTSYLLWWTCISHACDTGCRFFSFGRSTLGSGTHHYKSQWGTHNSTLYWNYSHPQENNKIKLGPFPFRLPGRNILAGIWKLIPTFIARRLGPLVAGKFY